MAERDYYEVLQVPRSASPDQIKSAYRKLAKKYHPDRNRGDKSAETRFKEVHDAYEVLNDPAKRRAYDQFGRAGVRGEAAGPGHRPGGGGWRPGPGAGQRGYQWQSNTGEVPIEDLEDLFSAFGGTAGGQPNTSGGAGFEDFFSRIGMRRGQGRRGRSHGPVSEESAGSLDIDHEVALSFEQAIHGTQLDLQISRDGRVETVTVKIPPGVSDGQRIRIRGKGQPDMRGGKAGDLYIISRVQPHPYFRRVGNDIYIDLPLTITEATLGTKVEIPTLEGKTVLTVPPSTPSGARLRLKNRGVKPPGDKPRGHQYAVIRIVPPKNLTPEQVRLLEQFRTSGENSPRAELGW
jgi:curved DNA-binding protein